MAAKQLEIHPSALAEFKSALGWYLERNQTAAAKMRATAHLAQTSSLQRQLCEQMSQVELGIFEEALNDAIGRGLLIGDFG